MALSIGWQPDTRLVVLDTITEEYRQYIQPGDVILAIDSSPALRGQRIFTTPVRSSYQFTLQRGERVFVQEVPVFQSQLFQMWILSISIMAMAFWFIGFMTVRFARPQHPPPFYVGLGFQLIGAGIISPGPSQFGAPGAWLVGNVLIFFFPLIMLYLGCVPRHKPLSGTALRIFQANFYLLVILAMVAAIEVVFLFPEQSLGDVTGIPLALILTIFAGVGVAGAVIILLLRLLRSPKQSYERQQLSILFVFLILAVTPLFFFIILPVNRFIFVPFPFVYSLFLLAPAGYFFVLHRHGHLELDALFSRIVTVVALTMAVGMAYITGVYLLDSTFQIGFDNLQYSMFAFLLFGVAVAGQRQVQTWVDLLFYGRDSFDQDSLQIVKTQLSANPEPTTVAEVVKQVAIHFNARHLAVLVRDGTCYKFLAGNAPTSAIDIKDANPNVCLRALDSDSLIGLPEWVDLSLPIKARGEMLGLFLLSRPVNGYFHSRQVRSLQDIAEILAFSLLVIGLVETMQHLSQKALLEKERQRQQIATEIHNVPLQTLASVMMQLKKHASDKEVQSAAETIRQVTQDLRRIISGLRPPVLRESLEWMTRQMIREFAETHDDIRVTLHPIEIYSDKQTDELTKMIFYYVLTESLNNISKHAQATEVDVLLSCDEDVLKLEVKDNGIGANIASQPLTELLRRHHIGVADMYRWASMAGGTLEIDTVTPSGTSVRLLLPIAAESGR